MIDHTQIRTGFDIEVLLGGDYWLTILQGAHAAGVIPSQIETDSGGVILLGAPTAVRVIADRDDADIEVTIPYGMGDTRDAVVGVLVTLAATEVALTYAYVDPTTKALIELAGLLGGNPNLFAEVEAKLQEALDRTIDLDLVGSDVAQMESRKVIGEGDTQAAIGLYLNLDLQIAPQSGPPESSLIARGDLDEAASFLPATRSFAVGLGSDTFPRLANDMWHGLGVVRDDGSIDHPALNDDDRIGVHKSVSIVPEPDHMKVTSTSRIFIDFWPDADVTAVFHFTPRTVNGRLTFDIELVDFDADTGLVGDLLAFLIGGLIGGLIGLLFGPVGVAIGASIGGVGGIATVEITEEVLEGQFEGDVESETQEAGVASAFSAFPVRKRLFSDSRDPFFVRHHELVSLFDEANVDANGMSFAGHAVMEPVNEPVPTVIVDKARGDSEDAWHGLESLTYRLGTADINLPIGEVLQRRPADQIARVGLAPLAIRRDRTVVTDIQFDTGLDLRVAESVALQDVDVIKLVGFQLIHPEDANPYYRARADGDTDNNFESLPPF